MPRLLVVDSEPLMIKAYRRRLKGIFDLRAVTDGHGVFDLIEQGSVDVILVDVAVAGQRSDCLAAELLERFPHMAERTVLSCGGIGLDRGIALRKRYGVMLLLKPFSDKALVVSLRAAALKAWQKEPRAR